MDGLFLEELIKFHRRIEIERFVEELEKEIDEDEEETAIKSKLKAKVNGVKDKWMERV